MKTQWRSRSSRVTAMILAFMMTLVFIPTFPLASYAAEEDGVTVYLTVNNQGTLAQAKDGSVMAEKEVTVTDIDGDGHYTFDEALVAAHDTYYDGGAAAGYDPGSGFAVKLWGVESTNNLFFVNGEGISSGVTVDEVKAGDSLYASANADQAYYADWYTAFDSGSKTVPTGEEITLNLSGHQGMAYTEEGKANKPVAGASIKDTAGNVYGTTDEEGNIKITFNEPGTYIVTAAGTVSDVVTDWNLMDLSSGQGWPRGTMNADMTEWNVAYTDADYQDGPYPAAEVKYIDFFEEADEESENNYAWEDLFYLKSNQLIADCPLMAPACVVTVVEPAVALDYDGADTLFVKSDLVSAFGMLRPQEGSTFMMSANGKKVKIFIHPKNTTVYAGFYLGGDIRLPGTWDEDSYISAKEDGTYEFELDASYCGKAWPVAPVKAEDMSATTSAQYYFAIPSADKLETEVIEPVTEIDYDGDEVWFVKEDLESPFGMLRPQTSPAPIYKLKLDGSKVKFKFTPKNKTVYAGFYIGADIRDPKTWDEEKFISAKEDGTYEFELDPSYCGKAWPVVPVKKSDLTETTSDQYYFAIPSVDILGQVAAPAEIDLTVNNKGDLAVDKNGEAMAARPVTVNDLNEDGYLTVDEAMIEAHDAYFEGGAEAGYSVGKAFSDKIWGVETSNILYYINDEGIPTGATEDLVAEGDSLYVSVNADDAYYSDWYTMFAEKDMAVKEDAEISVNLTGHLGMA